MKKILLIGAILAGMLVNIAHATDEERKLTSNVMQGIAPAHESWYAREVRTNPHKWTLTDTVFQVVATGLLIIDWRQTRYFVKQGREETNPLLGHHPSVDKVDAICLSTIVGQYAVSRYVLDKPWRTAWQSMFIVIDGGAVGTNISAGIGVRW